MKRKTGIGVGAALSLFILVLLFILVRQPLEQNPVQTAGQELAVSPGDTENTEDTLDPLEQEEPPEQETIVPELMSRAAVLYDIGTGKLLFEKDGDESISPASMTKLMTLHLAYKAIESGELSRETEITVSERADFRNQPRGSSLMFLEEGQELTLLELMRGLAVPSGNDAAVALAEAVSGTLEDFVEEMNREAERLGLKGVEFVEPAGIDSANRATARSFGRFCLIYLEEHPYALKELHGIEEYTYPNSWNLSDGAASVYGPITQENYNLLVGRHPWVDGLKTGYISEAGYNIAVTATHGERRLLAVVMGGPGENTREGNLSRVIDGTHLLSYGFYAYSRVRPRVPELETVRVWGGETKRLEIEMPEPEFFLVPAEKVGYLRDKTVIDGPLKAPVSEGEEVGRLIISLGTEKLGEYPITASHSVEEGGVMRRIWDFLGLRLLD
ncbi:MAG: D-alanyl-D-alanine carboxypeptidase family protein [Spirochaetaceae bacterium]